MRRENKSQRDEVMKTVLSGDAFKAVMAKHPDPDGYLQVAARFVNEM
jgi:hypothetical protein